MCIKGMDLKCITVLVQFLVPDSFNALIQCFGRAARNVSLSAQCILLAPPGYFYEEHVKRMDRDK